MNNQRYFNSNANEAAFLLGGIGTGNISVGARGQLRDFELFNHPNKGCMAPYTFFALRVAPDGQESVSRVLESQIQPPFSKSHGFNAHEVGGLARFKNSKMTSRYPFVEIQLTDDKLPVTVTMEAFTPFIPLNEKDSGIPIAILRYTVKNTGNVAADISVVGNIANLSGLNDSDNFGYKKYNGKRVNTYHDTGSLRGLEYTVEDLSDCSPFYGSMAFVTRENEITYKEKWLGNAWWDGLQELWNDFTRDGDIQNCDKYKSESETGDRIGSLCIKKRIEPGETKTFEFMLSWHFANRIKRWSHDEDVPADEDCCCGGCAPQKIFYSKMFKNAWDAAAYTVKNLGFLEGKSRDFANALYGSTLPDYVIDAVASNITVIRSTTCIWLDNGRFLGWEGCFDTEGCCMGTCTHVWNYAQTMAFLFPALERSMRETEYNLETKDDGSMAFRSKQVFELEPWDYLPAADGQMGTVVRLYREWKLSGDNDFLKNVWVNAKKSLDFAFTYWDRDGDFVLESQAHNTYDIEFYGPNSLTNSMFFAALLAGREMALAMGDEESASRYRNAFEKGSKLMDELLFNGEYYIQQIDDVNSYPYQYGLGCLSDQILGQFMAHVAGLGHVLPEDHVKKAISSVYKYNFRTSFEDHHNPQRTYALNDEAGLLLCTWPQGGRPELPFTYSDEVWTGIEYHVASNLIYDGFVDEGLAIVKAARDRHDGIRRNPWNEVECGHHYARSMSSYGVLTALSGFQFDMTKGTVSFDPRLKKDDFKCFFSCGKAWGIYDGKTNSVEILYGDESIKVL